MILFRYLAKETLLSWLAVSFTLLVIVMSSRLVKYLGKAASGDLAPEAVLSIMVFRLPGFLELVLPLGLFIAILLSYGRLYVESEMTVMSACGMSTRRLAVYTLIPSVLVAILVGWITMYAGPAGVGKVQEIFQEAKNSSSLDLIAAGRFRTSSDLRRVSYAGKLSDDRTVMQEVFSVEYSGPLTAVSYSIVFAERAHIKVNARDGARYLVLEEGNRYTGTMPQSDFQVTSFERYGQRIVSEEEDTSYKEVDSRTTQALWASANPEDIAALQWRISLVILVPVIALIAQALSKTNHRRGRYVKMLPAFLIYLMYLVLLNGARDAVEKGNIPVGVGLWWVHILFLILAFFLLFGGDNWRRMRHSFSGFAGRSSD